MIAGFNRHIAVAFIIVACVLPSVLGAQEAPDLLHRGDAAGAESPERLRFVTYNVLLFRGCPASQFAKHIKGDEQRINAFAEVFESLDADIFAVQESPSAALVQGVASKMNYHAARTQSGGYSGGAVLSRYPIVEFQSYKGRTDKMGPVFTHHFWRALIDLGGGEQVMVYGTHLNPAWGIDGEMRRLREVDAITTIMRESHKDGVPQVLMGDFNSNLGESMHRPILNTGLRDAWVIKPEGGRYTCNSVHQYVRIDRVYVSPHWSGQIIGAGAVRNRFTSPTSEHVPYLLSDHLPVRAEIALNQAPPPAVIRTKRDDLTLEIAGQTVTLPWVTAGSFEMGHDGGPIANQPRRAVTVSEGYWILEHEVTAGMWDALMLPEVAAAADRKEHPIVNVSYVDAQQFIAKLNEQFPQYTFALPTEAQWEYVARAGETNFSADVLTGSPMHNQPAEHEPQTQPVKRGKANAWGVHGMLGNVREWCRDAYHRDALTFLPGRDPLHIVADAKEYSVRGSSYLHEYGGGIVGRVGGGAHHRDSITGFRIVATPGAAAQSSR